MSETPLVYRKPPPRLGEHTDEVLRELQYNTEQIQRLKNHGVING
jgi:crotonobetainyl-CoA:carnitine CoA-transferase CaiB-like acyl-CoA transferase